MSDKKYENFTLSLACFDALPVAFFCTSVILIALDFKNLLFIAGAILCTLAGCLKVVWKILVAGREKDIQLLNKQMRFTMPVGFLLIIIGIINGKNNIDFSAFWSKATAMPCAVCFLITIAGMILMSIFAFTLDGTKAKSNWIEQITNAIAQGALLVGIISALYL